ncbi:MAG: hypothetical protein PVH96_10670 [Gemmatimonadota bacterium]|jgi:hypothetical protein
MPENQDTLLALAEIATAFAGFAALVSVIPRGENRTATPAHDLLRLRLVISGGVAGVVAAILPLGLSGFIGSTDLVWRLSAVAFLLLDNSVIWSFLGAYEPVRGSFPPDRLAVTIFMSLEVIEQVGLLAVLLGLGPWSPADVYVAALTANLVQAGFIFVRFVGSAFYFESGE